MGRAAGRFQTQFTAEDLLLGVRHVLERELGLASGEHLGQRPFDRARTSSPDWSGLPTARHIATRLKRAWPEVVRIAWQAEGSPSFADAAMTAERASSEFALGDRQTVAALRTVAIHLDVGTLTPTSYTTGVQPLLRQARRDGTTEYWRDLLPSAHQITSANQGSWDLALATAGLELRPGAELGDRAQILVVVARRRLGLDDGPSHQVVDGDDAESSSPPLAPARTRRRKLAGGTEPVSATRKAPVAEPDGAAAESATADEGRGPGRGGTKRVHRSQLTVEEAIAEFVDQQGSWPSGRGALDGWSRVYEIAVQRIKGGTEPYLNRAAEILRADGVTPPARQVRVSARRLVRDLPRQEHWPRRGTRQYTRDDCLRALERRYADVPAGRKLTRAFYVSWPPGANDAPSARVFDQFDGFAALRDEVHAQRNTGARRARMAE